MSYCAKVPTLFCNHVSFYLPIQWNVMLYLYLLLGVSQFGEYRANMFLPKLIFCALSRELLCQSATSLLSSCLVLLSNSVECNVIFVVFVGYWTVLPKLFFCPFIRELLCQSATSLLSSCLAFLSNSVECNVLFAVFVGC